MTKEIRLGIFIFLALACFAIAVFLIGNQESLFHPKYMLDTQFANVSGLEDGAPVRVGGIREGIVKRIVLPAKPGEKVTVQMSLERKTHGVVKKDSVASIQSEGLLGDKYIEIGFGGEDSPNVKSGDMIASQPPVDISDLIAKTDGILDNAGQAVENVKSLSGNLDQITAKINTGRGTAGQLVNNKALFQQATSATSALHEDAEALKHNFFLRGFFKKRGYEDLADLTKYEIAQLPEEPPDKTFDYDSKKIFDAADKSKLKDGKTLNEAGKFLAQGNFGLAVIAASTGMKGGTDSDKTLTEAQAYVVRDYLVKHFGIEDTKLKTIGLGKSSSTNVNRVEIDIYPEGSGTPAPATASRKENSPKP